MNTPFSSLALASLVLVNKDAIIKHAAHGNLIHELALREVVRNATEANPGEEERLWGWAMNQLFAAGACRVQARSTGERRNRQNENEKKEGH